MVQRKEYEENNKIEELVEENNDRQIRRNRSTNKKICNVLSTYKNKTSIDFDGYGITVNGTYNDTVTVEYVGQITESNFNIINLE